MPFNSKPTLEPNVQFERGWDVNDREGRFRAPSSACIDGTIVKVHSDGASFVVSGTSDGQYYLASPCASTGPIDSAANRELYLQGLPQHVVKTGTPIVAMPHKPGAVLWTTNYAKTGDGALTAQSVTVGTTLLEHFNGVWRIRQSTNKVMGKVIGFNATEGWVRIFLMEGIS